MKVVWGRQISSLFVALFILCFTTEYIHASEGYELKLSGKAEFRFSHFPKDIHGKDEGYSELLFRPALLIKVPRLMFSIKIAPDIHQGISGVIYKGSDLTPETKRSFDFRELYLNFDLNLAGFPGSLTIGKQLFALEEGIFFDAVNFNPFGAKDFSEPFLAIEEEKDLGVWGASLKWNFLERYRAEFIVNGHNQPIIATDSNYRWTRELPLGLTYGSQHLSSNINSGIRLFGKQNLLGRDISWGAILYQGSANAVDHLVLDGTKVRPVLPREYSLGAFLQFPVSDYTVRLGCIQHWQHHAEDFLPWAVEIERLFEDVLMGGDNLFIELGYAGVKTTGENDTSIEEIDMRRVLKDHLVFSFEYSPWEFSIFKLKGAYNPGGSDFYISPEVVWDLGNIFKKMDIEICVKGEIIQGASQGRTLNSWNNLFSQYKYDDRILMTFEYNF
ncbi:MAG: hypothetical protein NT096_10690 [Proteobacteria bacterium]|nr:hypothetical protein [Pseudomonadota bacterium]